MRTLKKPQVIFNKKYISKISIHSSKNIVILSKVNKDIFAIKTEITSTRNEIVSLLETLSKVKENFGYSDFVEEREKQTLIERERAYQKLYNVNTTTGGKGVTTKALTVVKKGYLLEVANTTKKAAKFSLKSLLISLTLSFLNFFI